MTRKLACMAVAFSIFALSPAFPETFDKGDLTIKCSCKVGNEKIGLDRYTWDHNVKVPSDGFTIDLDQVCQKASNNYSEPETLCEGDFRGEVSSFTPN